jgi:hypothetical protein
MKNSSRLLLKMALNFACSSSGVLFAQGLGQHPLVEGNPAQLPVDVERGIDHGCS